MSRRQDQFIEADAPVWSETLRFDVMLGKERILRLPSISRLGAGNRRRIQTAVLFALGSALAGCDSNLSPENSFLDQSELSKAKDGLIVPILDRLNNSADTGDAQFAHA